MAKLIYSAIASLDGYIADREGKWDWCMPDAEVHAFLNEVEKPVSTHLYGRRMYEVMKAWEPEGSEDEPQEYHDFGAMWRAADKTVYSTTLEEVTTTRTRLERAFEPDAVRQLKADAETDISIGGASIAAAAFKAGLIDECHLYLAPVIIGGGKAALPDDVRVDLELLDERRFGNGMVYVRYRTAGR